MLGFHCDCSIEPDWFFEDWQEEEVVADQPLTCCECRESIPPGQIYWAASGINPDELGEDDLDEYEEPNDKAEEHREHYPTCIGCHRIAERFCPSGYVLTELREQVHECLNFYYTDDPADWDQYDVDEEDEANRLLVLTGMTDLFEYVPPAERKQP